MSEITATAVYYKSINHKKPEFYLGIIFLIIGLSVIQDYFYSRLQHTGFYISESLLYNSLWLFLIPLTFLNLKYIDQFRFQNQWTQILARIVSSSVMTVVHLFIFASFFVAVSHLVFSPSHRFSRIFNAAISNQFYILILFYLLTPYIFRKSQNVHDSLQLTVNSPDHIKVKNGLKTVSLQSDVIESIMTEKPYTMIVSEGKKYLDNRTLKEFECLLDSPSFARVHRSAIINKSHVMELQSRKNGDYDALLKNGKRVRLSRHYRSNWQDLLH